MAAALAALGVLPPLPEPRPAPTPESPEPFELPRLPREAFGKYETALELGSRFEDRASLPDAAEEREPAERERRRPLAERKERRRKRAEKSKARRRP
jgi:hypothetical protein